MKIQFIILLISFFSCSIHAQNDTAKNIEEEIIFTVIEEMPRFIGGIEALEQYINSNAKYTQKAYREKAAGRVFVSFYVEIDSSITEPIILRGLHPDLDSISLTLVKNMPKWIPAKLRGKPIKCQYNLPIEFNLYKIKVEKTKSFIISKYWNNKGKKNFMKICTNDFKKSPSECDCWYYYIVWSFNDMKLDELKLNELFNTQKCN